MFFIHDPVLQHGSAVLVTGVSGFVGSHIADQLLAAGYLVRGTTRDAVKNSWIATLFNEKYGEGKFELFAITDIEQPNIFDPVLKGVSGIIHAASDMTMDSDPNKVIPPMVAGSINLLRAAARHQEVKRFVLTSSCAAAASPKPGVGCTIDKSTWNEEAIQQAWAPPPYEPERGFAVYAASKTQSEQEAWKWYKEHKPHFLLNTVLPSMNIGKSLDPVTQGHPSTSGIVEAVFKGDFETVNNAAQYFFIDVQDNARLHVAALTHPEIFEERVFAYAQPYTWRGVQRIIQKLYQGKTFFPEVPDALLDSSQIMLAPRAESWLRDMGRTGWTSLEESVRLNTEDLV